MESCICLICQKTDEPAFIRSRTTARLLGLLTSFRAIPSRSGVVGKEVFRCCMAVVSSCRPKHSGAGDGGVLPRLSPGLPFLFPSTALPQNLSGMASRKGLLTL